VKHKKLIKVGIVPTIREIYKNQFEWCFDFRITLLLDKIFKKINFTLLNKDSSLNKIDLIIFCGGNNLRTHSKKKSDKIRHDLDLMILKKSIKQKKSILGICHGMQMIAKFFGSKLTKKKHIGNHKIILTNNKKIANVNSYHNYILKSLPKKLEILAKAEDGSCEAFINKKNKILGIMWHPERFKKIRSFDVNFIKKHLCN
jgi:gamma-glutamyl-gamma-aminobutyrate hydrolase PuuD